MPNIQTNPCQRNNSVAMYPNQYPTRKLPKRNLTNCTNLESFPFDSSSNIFRVSLYPFEGNKKNLIFK